MSESNLEHLDIAVLLAVSVKRTGNKPPTLTELRTDLLLCVPSIGALDAERVVDAAIVRALERRWLERIEPAKTGLPRFALTETGAYELEAVTGEIPAVPKTWAFTWPFVLGAQTTPANLRDRTLEYGFLRAFLLARALGFDDRIVHAKTESDVLNILAAAVTKSPNAEPDKIREVAIRRWIEQNASVSDYASGDEARILEAPPAKPAPKPRTPKAPAEPKQKAAPKPKVAPKPKAAPKPKSESSRKKSSAGAAATSRAKKPKAANAIDVPSLPSPGDSLESFAEAVRAAASLADGRVGRKAFISRVWAVFRSGPIGDGMTFETFARQLVEANRRQLLTLSRADLPRSFPPDDVRDSAVAVLGEDVHFITIEDER